MFPGVRGGDPTGLPPALPYLRSEFLLGQVRRRFHKIGEYRCQVGAVPPPAGQPSHPRPGFRCRSRRSDPTVRSTLHEGLPSRACFRNSGSKLLLGNAAHPNKDSDLSGAQQAHRRTVRSRCQDRWDVSAQTCSPSFSTTRPRATSGNRSWRRRAAPRHTSITACASAQSTGSGTSGEPWCSVAR